ncbi:MAG: hypothetical protein IPI82_07020 [Candidatus Microthrix sp.]|nr:hypothetical protein [Candidatus Microthrix sp.]MBK7322195.1 hypothetical protein [Candidatus Microthrix sp.]
MNVFAVEGNQATIVHLTGEKLRGSLPWPRYTERREIERRLDEMGQKRSAHGQRVDPRQVDLLAERRQALITAAVTGELEIPGVAA